MNITDFSPPQRQALLDLLVLAMYVDGNLATVEDDRIQKLLGTMGLDSDYDRGRDFDASVTRVRHHSETPEKARAHAVSLAKNFSGGHRREVYDQLNDLLTSDNQVTSDETTFLSVVKEVLGL